jgi:hypothetical protein
MFRAFPLYSRNADVSFFSARYYQTSSTVAQRRILSHPTWFNLRNGTRVYLHPKSPRTTSTLRIYPRATMRTTFQSLHQLPWLKGRTMGRRKQLRKCTIVFNRGRSFFSIFETVGSTFQIPELLALVLYLRSRQSLDVVYARAKVLVVHGANIGV